jgi:hypothetical protein
VQKLAVKLKFPLKTSNLFQSLTYHFIVTKKQSLNVTTLHILLQQSVENLFSLLSAALSTEENAFHSLASAELHTQRESKKNIGRL